MKKLYLDMDGVLADFDGQPNALKRFVGEKGFFQSLQPTCLAIEINKQIGLDPKLKENVFILSASPNSQADQDKWAWLQRNMPNLKTENIHIIRGGAGADERKAKFADKRSILVDDYSQNLIVWERNGGKGVKLLNGRNGKGKTWKGETLTLDTLLTK